jgi:hypothetical protein
MLTLHWNRCQGDTWCKLNKVNLDHAHFNDMDGVYVIWHGGSAAATVFVGSGQIRSALIEQRKNVQTQAFNSLGLFVTWARVTKEQQDSVVAFLNKVLKPKVVNSVFHLAPAESQVNLPWR